MFGSPKVNSTGVHADGICGSIAPPPRLCSWAPYPGFVITLSLHLELIWEPILLDFGVDLA